MTGNARGSDAANADDRTAPVSVVIATLGGACVRETIEVLNAGSRTPAEILVCIPEREAGRVSALTNPNVRVVVTECRGQVAQRAVGFRAAASEFVMQLDDDMLLDHDCMELLLDTIRTHGPSASVSPAVLCLETGESLYKGPARELDRLRRGYLWLLGGSKRSQPGTVSKYGGLVGIDPAETGEKVIEVEWLPGGCALHSRAHLVRENFFPYPGKAYYEDLIHSWHLAERKVRMFVDARARVRTKCGEGLAYIPTFKDLRALLAAQRYYVNLASLSRARFYLYALVTSVTFLAARR